MDLMPRTRWLDEFVMAMSRRFHAGTAAEIQRYAQAVWIYRRHEVPAEAVELQRMPMSDVQFWPALEGIDAWLEAKAGIIAALEPDLPWDDCQQGAYAEYLADKTAMDANPAGAIEKLYAGSGFSAADARSDRWR